MKLKKNKETRLFMEAISELGDTRLAATIFCLRKRGFNIVSTSETNINRYGEKVTYARYIYIP